MNVCQIIGEFGQGLKKFETAGQRPGLGRSTPTRSPNRRFRRSHGVWGNCGILEPAGSSQSAM